MPARSGYVVPTIFTAVDRLSSVVSRMGRNVNNFVGRAQVQFGKLNKWVNSLIPGFGGLGGQLWGFVRSMIIISGLFGALNFGVGAVIEYEKQLAGLHSILSDLSKTQLGVFDRQIKNTAKITRESAVDVAAAYAQIAELNPDLAKTAVSLDAVARSAITLSKASKGALPLKEAAQSLVTIMTQFKFGADQADRVANTLAAGAKYGSAPIEQAAEAFSRFASVARRANVTLEESNALVQILAASGFQASEAGNAIKASITRLQLAGAGYSSGVFKIGDAFGDVVKKYKQIKSAKGKDKFLFDVFGIHRIAQAGELIGNLSKFDELTRKLTNTNEAAKAAAINGDTVAESWRRLKNTFANYLITDTKVGKGMARLRKLLEYVTDNMDGLIDKAITFIKWFAILKGTMWAVNTVFLVYNTTVKVGAALIWAYTFALRAFQTVMVGWPVVTWAATKATVAFSAALTGISGAGLLRAAGAIGKASFALAVLAGMIKGIHDNWDSVKKSFSDKGFLSGLATSFRAVIAGILEPVQKMIMWLAGVTGSSSLSNLATNKVPTTPEGWKDFVKTGDATGHEQIRQVLMSPSVKAQDVANNQREQAGRVGIDIYAPPGVVKSTSTKGTLVSDVKVSSTNGQK